jgi:Hpt domain
MTDFEAQLAQLYASFRLKLPAQDVVLALALDNSESVSLEELQKIVHFLAGSGGTFGCPMISVCANAVDLKLMQSGPAQGRFNAADLAPELIALRQAIADILLRE